jgi:hypothetical protein
MAPNLQANEQPSLFQYHSPDEYQLFPYHLSNTASADLLSVL